VISAPPLLLVLGPEGHGVTRYGDDVAVAVTAADRCAWSYPRGSFRRHRAEQRGTRRPVWNGCAWTPRPYATKCQRRGGLDLALTGG